MFLQNMLTAAEQVAVLYLIVAVGVIADKTGLYTEKVAKSCTDLLFYIATPAMIINSFFTLEYNSQTAKGLFIALGCGFILHFVSAVLPELIFLRCPKDRACIFKYAAAYGNCGYMGLPLAGAVAGEEGVFYCSAVIISFQIFSFTHGIYIMNKREKGGRAKFDLKMLLLNPGVVSVIVGMPVFLLSLKLPTVVTAPVQHIANITTPMAMLIFGTYIANTKFSSMFKEWRIAVVALFKLVLLPLVLLPLFRLMGLDGTLLTALIICACAPSANNTVMFAAKYDRDTGLASQTVAAVSFISIITMPVMIALAQTAG